LIDTFLSFTITFLKLITHTNTPITMTSTLHSRILGTWSLLSYAYFPQNSPSSKTYPLGPDAHGTILYHPSGHMSAVLVRPGQPPFSDGGGLTPETSGTAADWAAVGRNVIAYSGRFWIRDEQTVVHELGVCVLPRLVGAVQERRVEFAHDGREMVLSVDGVDVGDVKCKIEVVWKREGDNDVTKTPNSTSLHTTK
jgi:hypothetical protein